MTDGWKASPEAERERAMCSEEEQDVRDAQVPDGLDQVEDHSPEQVSGRARIEVEVGIDGQHDVEALVS
jgi:hypothetical protein